MGRVLLFQTNSGEIGNARDACEDGQVVSLLACCQSSIIWLDILHVLFFFFLYRGRLVMQAKMATGEKMDNR